jgi:hypothetical protein
MIGKPAVCVRDVRTPLKKNDFGVLAHPAESGGGCRAAAYAAYNKDFFAIIFIPLKRLLIQ